MPERVKDFLFAGRFCTAHLFFCPALIGALASALRLCFRLREPETFRLSDTLDYRECKQEFTRLFLFSMRYVWHSACRLVVAHGRCGHYSPQRSFLETVAGSMRITAVTRIVRIVFLVWLVVTAVLFWHTVRRPARSAHRHEIGSWQ